MVLLRALGTFIISLGMGMVGFFLGGVIYMGISKYLLAMSNERMATAIAVGILFGSALLGGIFGLQKGAKWTRLMDSIRGG